VFGRNSRTVRTEVLDRGWQQVKEKLLQELAWGGLPQIELVDDDCEGRGELLLRHHHDGRDLQLAHAGETLEHVARVWRKPVHLLTQEEGSGRKLTSDGRGFQSTEFQLEGAGKTNAAV
jgi:stage V sporulation protein R